MGRIPRNPKQGRIKARPDFEYEGVPTQIKNLEKQLGKPAIKQLKEEAKKEGKTLRKKLNLKRANNDLELLTGDGNFLRLNNTSDDGYVTLAPRSNSSFYNPIDRINSALKENLEQALAYQPVRQIKHDKKSVETDPMTFKRCLAMKYIKLYYRENYFLSKMKGWSRRGPLSELQCDLSIEIGKKLKAQHESK